MLTRGVLGGLVAIGLFLGGTVGAEEKPAAALGAKVPAARSLRDLRGNRRPLYDFKGQKAVVVVFLGTECPVSNLYLPELIQLEKKYRSRAVQFLAVYPNDGEDLDQIAAHAYDRDTPFPVLKDVGQKLADAVGVTRVPTVVVLDGEFVLRYRGRVDDQYGVAGRRPKATRADLAEALDDVLAGKSVRVAETEADGCLIARRPEAAARTTVTYSHDVASILQSRCQGCHRPGQAAPFSLLTYADAAKHGRMIREVAEQRRMPPWHADPRYGHFTNERRLTKAEIDTLSAWVAAGMPEGDPRDLPRPADWPTGWAQGKPDVVFEMPEAYNVPATGVQPYKNWIIDTHFTEDKWVQMAECRPGAPGVVHHIVAYILRGGDQRERRSPTGALSVLVGWAPGDLGLVCPPDTALRIPKGARLRLEMHYTPNGVAVPDRSAVGITFAKKPPKYELFTNEFANVGIAVPPNDPHYRAEATLRLPADARIISFVPHMHWRGKDYRYEVIYPDGRRETILSVPRWDFAWQSVYRLREPLHLPKGAKLHAVAHWDNSKNNPINPKPNETVYFGLQSWEEMMVGWVSYTWERPETAAELAKNPPKPADLFFDRLDVNGDDVLTPDEIPLRFRPFLMASGTKLPDRITREEFAKMFEEMRKRMGRNRPQFGRGANPDKKPDAKEPAKKP